MLYCRASDCMHGILVQSIGLTAVEWSVHAASWTVLWIKPATPKIHALLMGIVDVYCGECHAQRRDVRVGVSFQQPSTGHGSNLLYTPCLYLRHLYSCWSPPTGVVSASSSGVPSQTFKYPSKCTCWKNIQCQGQREYTQDLVFWESEEQSVHPCRRFSHLQIGTSYMIDIG